MFEKFRTNSKESQINDLLSVFNATISELGTVGRSINYDHIQFYPHSYSTSSQCWQDSDSPDAPHRVFDFMDEHPIKWVGEWIVYAGYTLWSTVRTWMPLKEYLPFLKEQAFTWVNWYKSLPYNQSVDIYEGWKIRIRNQLSTVYDVFFSPKPTETNSVYIDYVSRCIEHDYYENKVTKSSSKLEPNTIIKYWSKKDYFGNKQAIEFRMAAENEKNMAYVKKQIQKEIDAQKYRDGLNDFIKESQTQFYQRLCPPNVLPTTERK